MKTLINRLLGRPTQPVETYEVPAFDLERDTHPGWRSFVLGPQRALELDD